MEISNLSDAEFKTLVRRMLKELGEVSTAQTRWTSTTKTQNQNSSTQYIETNTGRLPK